MFIHAMYFTTIASETLNALKYTNSGSEKWSGQLRMHDFVEKDTQLLVVSLDEPEEILSL